MKVLLLVAGLFGFVLGAAVVAPRLIEWSPTGTAVLVLALLLVVSYFKVQRREKQLDEEAQRSMHRFRGPR